MATMTRKTTATRTQTTAPRDFYPGDFATYLPTGERVVVMSLYDGVCQVFGDDKFQVPAYDLALIGHVTELTSL